MRNCRTVSACINVDTYIFPLSTTGANHWVRWKKENSIVTKALSTRYPAVNRLGARPLSSGRYGINGDLRLWNRHK